MKLLKNTLNILALCMCHHGILSAQTVDEFRIGMIAMPPAQGNPYFTTGTTPHMFYPAIYDTLTRVNEKGDVEPQIAIHWAQIDRLTWTLDIRQGASFSNGEPINAETVVSTFKAFSRDDFTTFSLPREFDFIAGMRALNNKTVEITTIAPQALLPRYMSFFYLLPPNHVAKNGSPGLASDPIGSGPFLVETWLAQRILLHYNPTSWRPPKVNQLEALALPQSTTRLQALASGRIDVAINLGPDDKDTLDAHGLRLQARNPVRVSVIALNTQTEGSPFTDVRLRQAMNYAVNKKAMTESLMGGEVEPASQPTPRNAIGFDPTLRPYPYDVDKARALMADAGMAEGFSVIFEVVAGASSSNDAVMQQIAADLAKINIRAEVRPIMYSQVVSKMHQGGWDGHMFAVDFATGPTMDGLRPIRLHSCAWSTPWYCDSFSQNLYEQAKIAPTREARVTLTQQVIKRYRDEATTILLFPILGMDGLGPRVKTWATLNDRPIYQLAELISDR